MFLITVPSRHCLVTFLLLSILQRTRNEGISVTNLCLDIHVCAHLIVNLQFDRGYFDTPTICSTDAQYPSEHLPLLTKYLLQFSGDDCKKKSADVQVTLSGTLRCHTTEFVQTEDLVKY